MTDHERNTEHYNYDAWGEHTDTANLPPTENNVRYGGARVECFAKSVTSQDAIYLCGERHYWPAYGRFLQRDRMGYEKLPAPSSPLGANPYIYAENNPVMKKDLSGLQPAGYYRGARMGSGSFYIGTEMPPESQMYDCCDKGYNTLSAQEVAMSPVWNEKLGGTARFSWWQKRAGWGSDLCQAKPGEGQPNETCKAITAASPDLLCTYLEQCEHLSCPPWKDGSCPIRMPSKDLGFEGDPRSAGFPSTLVKFTDDFGNAIWLPADDAAFLIDVILPKFHGWYQNFDDTHRTGNLQRFLDVSSFLGSLPAIAYNLFEYRPWVSCSEIQDMLWDELSHDRWYNHNQTNWQYGYAGHTAHLGNTYWGLVPPWRSGFTANADNWIGLYLPNNPNWFLKIDVYNSGQKIEIVSVP